ncbi:MAG: GNAT family N-acetyltransferase [Opitutaceae bacterium]
MHNPPTVEHLIEKSCFEIRHREALAHLDYRLDSRVMTIHHTFVPPELRGQSIAGKLAGAAFEFAQAEGLKVVPQCSYIGVYAKRHPEVAALLA